MLKMTSLRRQLIILFHLYEGYSKGWQESYAGYATLKQYEDLSYIPDKEFEVEIRYLIESGYIDNPHKGIFKLSTKGVKIVELAARRFLAYFKLWPIRPEPANGICLIINLHYSTSFRS
jgi:hypothetical protein